jgi:hypothetical protein
VERDGQRMALELKSPILETDKVLTDDTGKVQILFVDDGSVTVGANSSLDIQEVALAGDNPSFKAFLGQGVARFITGKIVDANPEGFTVATPAGTAGIRGTMFVASFLNNKMTIAVINATKSVLLNGVPVPPGMKMTIPGDTAPVPMTPQDLQQAQSLAAAGGGERQEEALPEEQLVAFPDVDETLNTVLAEQNLGNQSLGDSLGAVATGHVSGSIPYFYNTDAFNSNNTAFSFDVNLTSGALSNGSLTGGMITSMDAFRIDFNFSGGSGTADAGGWLLENMTGTLVMNGVSAPVSVADLHGTQNLLDLGNGAAITGEIEVGRGDTLEQAIDQKDNGNPDTWGEISGSMSR